MPERKAGTRLRSEIAAQSDWLIVGTVCTVLLAALALTLSPDRSGIVPALMLLPRWVLASFAMAGMLVGISTLRLMRRKVDRPLVYWWEFSLQNQSRIALFMIGVLLTGLNMISFMWVKRLLNHLAPFSADPLLAQIDRAIFHTDPWRLLAWLNTPAMTALYHRAWFALIVLILVMVLTLRPSRERTALLWTYFLLWSVFGPVVHVLAPAAGPVFYARLGYGDLFAGLVPTADTQRLTDYLWVVFSGSKVGPVSGISAMPSMHIAMVAWMTIAVHALRRRWFVPMFVAGLLIFLLSVALGWHYAIDGIVGAAGAWLIWKACLGILSTRRAGENSLSHAA